MILYLFCSFCSFFFFPFTFLPLLPFTFFFHVALPRGVLNK